MKTIMVQKIWTEKISRLSYEKYISLPTFLFMPHHRNKYPSEFKVKVVLEVLSNTATLAEISSKYSLHPTMVSSWKAEFLERTKNTFTDPRKKSDELREKEEALEEAYKQIGQVTIERDWLKKKFRQLGGV
jgi:transposase-like protein